MKKIIFGCNLKDLQMVKNVLIFVFLMVPFLTFSQDEILMLSGHVIEGKISAKNNDYITIDIDKKGKTRPYQIDLYRIFSYSESGKETVLYVKDEEKGNYLSADEMRNFTYGAKDAMQYYKGRWAFFSGLGVGAVGGFILGNSYVAIALPLVYPFVTSIHHIKPTNAHTNHPDLLEDPAYKAGFLKNTKTTRIFQSLKGTLLGTAVGVGAYQAIN